jgi:hypothetical protein
MKNYERRIGAKNQIARKNNVDIQPPGTNPYFRYEFVPATTATAVGVTRQPTWYGVRSASISSCGPQAY